MSCSIDVSSNCTNDVNNNLGHQNQMLTNQQSINIPSLLTSSSNNNNINTNITTLTSLGSFTTNQPQNSNI